jgi:hypothetical protein
MAVRTHHLSIVEAIETLSNIADLEFDREIGIVQKHELIIHRERIAYKTVYWLHKRDAPATITLVREIFRIILHYLQQFYKGEYGSITDQKAVEGIKAIMVLVSEAAKNLDNYGNFLHPQKENKSSVTEFKEYKLLQEFYSSKFSRKKDEGGLSKWIMSLSLKGKDAKEFSFNLASNELLPTNLKDTKRVFVDLATVKKDTEYELFFIRKQDGSRFFSPRLLRNIKIVCDFESYFGIHKRIDPLEQLNDWYDRIIHSCARQIMKGIGGPLDLFLKELRKIKNNELIDALNKTVMALMFSAQGRNLSHHQPIKNCTEYFEDFLQFLREAMETKTYQRWITHPPSVQNHTAHDLLELVHMICRQIYTNLLGWDMMQPVVEELIKEGRQIVSKDSVHESSNDISSRLATDYVALARMCKFHPNGPLQKVLKTLENGGLNEFDPLQQHNIPQQLFDLYTKEQRISLIRMPAPVYQRAIQRAAIIHEFKGFLRSYRSFSLQKKHLVINLQNRTSWLEYARCAALEELQFQSDVMNELCVVTLALDTDFYSQLAPYHQMNQANTFIEQFKEHIKSEHSGFYFPPTITRSELEKFTHEISRVIHKVFFADQVEMSREQRLDYIEIFYLFLFVKVIDWANPQTFSLMCKDGIDIGATKSTELLVFLKLINGVEWTERDWEFVDLMLHVPALMLRERVVLVEWYNRMVSTLRRIEKVRSRMGLDKFVKLIHQEFGGFYQSPILESIILLPHKHS